MVAGLFGDGFLQLHHEGTYPTITKTLRKGNYHADAHVTDCRGPVSQIAQVNRLDVLDEEVVVLG